MKALLLLLSLGFTQQTFNPSGLWEVVDKDTQYRLTRTGTGIHVSLGADRAQFVEYEVDLSWTELNSYKGVVTLSPGSETGGSADLKRSGGLLLPTRGELSE